MTQSKTYTVNASNPTSSDSNKKKKTKKNENNDSGNVVNGGGDGVQEKNDSNKKLIQTKSKSKSKQQQQKRSNKHKKYLKLSTLVDKHYATHHGVSRFALHHCYNETPCDVGFLPFPQEIEYSRPNKSKVEDIMIFGANFGTNQSTIMVHLRRRPVKVSKLNADEDRYDVSFELNDGNTGMVYWLEERDVITEHSDNEYRTGAGLSYEVLQPNKIARIKFRGYLRRRRRRSGGQDTSTDDNDDDNDGNTLYYVRMRLFCLFYSKPVDNQRQYDLEFLRNELKQNQIEASSSLDIDFEQDILENRIEQYCHFKGTIKVEKNDEQELNFLGSVAKRIGETKTNVRKRVIQLVGHDCDGSVFHFGLVQANAKNENERKNSQKNVNNANDHQWNDQSSNSIISFRYGYVGYKGENFSLLKHINIEKKNFVNLLNNNNNNKNENDKKPTSNGDSTESSSSLIQMTAHFRGEKKSFHFELQPLHDTITNGLMVVKLNNVDGIAQVKEWYFDDESTNNDDEGDDDEKAITETDAADTNVDSVIDKDNDTNDPSLFVVTLDEPQACQVSLTGGKGASLAQLARLSKKISSVDTTAGIGDLQPSSSATDDDNVAVVQFTVPLAVVVTSVAYQCQLESLGETFVSKLSHLTTVTYDNEQSIEYKQKCCEEFSTWFAAQPLHQSIGDALRNKLTTLVGGNDTFEQRQFAVRSSATMEDSAEMSAAGQMTTYLGVRGFVQLCNAVMHCWASQFAYIPIQYKHGYGQQLNSPMAVVVQEMVNCDAAGVIFTADPVSGDERLLMVTANFGLGESVVSAAADPDTFELSVDVKANSYDVPRKVGQIVSRRLGKKSLITRLNSNTGTGGEATNLDAGIQEEHLEDGASKQCITDTEVHQLGVVALAIQRHYRNARDIEWGIKGSQEVYIFQSRPITALDSTFTEYELRHEMDTPHMCENEIYSRAHWGENYPGASSWVAFMLMHNEYFFLLDKQKPEEEFNPYKPMMGIVENQLMFNLSSGLFGQMLCKYPNDDVSRALVMALFGRQLNDPELFESFAKTKHKLETSTKSSIGKMNILQILKMVISAPKSIQGYWCDLFTNHRYDIVEHLQNDQVPLIEQFNILISQTILKLYIACSLHAKLGMGSSMKNFLLRKILASSNSVNDDEIEADLSLLMSHCNDVVSAEVPDMLRGVAKAVKNRQKFIQLSDQEALQVLMSKMTTTEDKKSSKDTVNNTATDSVVTEMVAQEEEAAKLFARFIERHGHRGYKECDPMYFTWKQDPLPCVKVVKSLLTGNEASLAEKQHKTVDQLLNELRTPLNMMQRLAIKSLVLSWVKNAVGYREQSKSMFAKHFSHIREGFDVLGAKMVAAGLLPEARLIYYLKVDETSRLCAGERNAALVMKAKQRKRIYPTMHALKFDEFIKGFNMHPKQTSTYRPQGDVVLKGTPVTVGSIQARVCVAPTIEEAINIQPGDILLTYSTDIGWSPYFPLLSGIVTEIGGTISHGAVIAREYGIPCLIAVEDVCAYFTTGDIAYLNTADGTLVKVNVSPSPTNDNNDDGNGNEKEAIGVDVKATSN